MGSSVQDRKIINACLTLAQQEVYQRLLPLKLEKLRTDLNHYYNVNLPIETIISQTTVHIPDLFEHRPGIVSSVWIVLKFNDGHIDGQTDFWVDGTQPARPPSRRRCSAD